MSKLFVVTFDTTSVIECQMLPLFYFSFQSQECFTNSKATMVV